MRLEWSLYLVGVVAPRDLIVALVADHACNLSILLLYSFAMDCEIQAKRNNSISESITFRIKKVNVKENSRQIKLNLNLVVMQILVRTRSKKAKAKKIFWEINFDSVSMVLLYSALIMDFLFMCMLPSRRVDEHSDIDVGRSSSSG